MAATPRDQLVTDDDDHRRDVEPRAAGEQPRDEEDGAGRIARGDAEADLEEFVNGDDVVVVKRADEKIGDDDAREDGADGQLRVEEIALVVALGGRAEEGGGAQLRRDDGGEDGPPGKLTTADAELAHVVAAMAGGGEADADDEGEIGHDGDGVPEVRHVKPRRARGRRHVLSSGH